MKRFLVLLSQSDQSDIDLVNSKKNRETSTSISGIDRNVQNNIFDISQNVENGPSQPIFTFPGRNIGGKKDHLIFRIFKIRMARVFKNEKFDILFLLSPFY